VLSYGVVCVILRLAVLAQCRLVTDRRRDRQTDRQTHDDSIYLASIASRGKNLVRRLIVARPGVRMTNNPQRGRGRRHMSSSYHGTCDDGKRFQISYAC